ncbi:hypothetical protein QQF64_002666 [Cirrhinus molitorella]|uniref:Uncharacterized protein n=2 Tax=Cirrhinus molitorella TaxID=172907 RepID=A0AA88TD26_9TELE|nr:hypothetical protein Q8A67_024004 [Cirrhinus molitorella]
MQSAYRVACIKVRLRALEAVVCCCNSATVGRKILFKIDFYPLANNPFHSDFTLLLPYRESASLKGQTGDSESISGPCSHNEPVIHHQIAGEGNSSPPFPLLFPKLLCPLPLIISPETLFLKAS